MEVVEDLTIDMLHHVVGMPQAWVQNLRCVAKAVVAYLATHLEQGIRCIGHDYDHLSPNFVYYFGHTYVHS